MIVVLLLVVSLSWFISFYFVLIYSSFFLISAFAFSSSSEICFLAAWIELIYFVIF